MSLHKTYTESRDMVILTGKDGMDRYHKLLQKENDISFADFLHESGKLSYEQKEVIINMINSSDEENLVIAHFILEEYSNKLNKTQDGSNISSRES